MRPPVRAVAGLVLAAVLGVTSAAADEPFYKGKRLTILVNFAAGGPTDIEARMFAKHLVRHVDGAPNIIIQNMDGAGGVAQTLDLGRVTLHPRGTLVLNRRVWGEEMGDVRSLYRRGSRLKTAERD